MGPTEHHGAADAIAEPLLPSSTVAVEPPPPHRNMFAFVCATLASMTTILMGYSTLAATLLTCFIIVHDTDIQRSMHLLLLIHLQISR
jgi:hypothetical protein